MRAPRERCRRLPAAIAAAALVLAGCGAGGPDTVAPPTGATGSLAGVYFLVSVGRPDGGVVDSTEPAHRIHCGPAGSGADACGPATYGWSETATLVATPKAGYAFSTWAGDCTCTGPCVLQAGADKYVVAVFDIEGQQGHCNYTSPQRHGPAYLDMLGDVPGHLNCTLSSCHGPTLQGAGIAPGCFDCHAKAGWSGWRTNCSFCHGARTAESKAGYAVGDHPTWSAPPDAVWQRLGGAAVPSRTGAHQAHLTGASASGLTVSAPWSCDTCHAVPTDLSHVQGSAARATVVLSASGGGALPADLGAYDPSEGTCTTYCHGGTVSPVWDAGSIDCRGCHGAPPPPPHPAVSGAPTRCAQCHPTTVRADGTIDTSPQGTHVDGKVDLAGGGACNGCHGFPPATGAHSAHDGLTSVGASPSGYGDERVLEDRVADVRPSEAPAVYAFGCGNCHPLDVSKHMDDVVDVELFSASAAAGSLKALADPGAAYDGAAHTCSGTYCHSSGQATPLYAATPGWTSGAHLACDGCHGNPPRYPSGGPASTTANSHLGLGADGREHGHFPTAVGVGHGPHGEAVTTGRSASPITCQACHADTVDPAATGPSGFYYLDTTGSYRLPGGDPLRLGTPEYAALQCTACHVAGSASAPLAAGGVLPLRHVNGSREVVLDRRETLPAIPWLPADAPVAPYWSSGLDTQSLWPPDVVVDGTTASFSLAGASYDPVTKRCSGVACHLSVAPVWGGLAAGCDGCHTQHHAP